MCLRPLYQISEQDITYYSVFDSNSPVLGVCKKTQPCSQLLHGMESLKAVTVYKKKEKLIVIGLNVLFAYTYCTSICVHTAFTFLILNIIDFISRVLKAYDFRVLR